MTADLPTHPSTEAVGEVRRREEIVVDLKRLHDSLPADYERERRELPQRILAERNAAVADVAKLITEVEKLRSDLSAMTLERDLAIAYDRQAYPTADAYERVCASHRRYRDLADRATAFLVNLADHDAKVGGVEAGKLRSEFAAHVATQPDLCSLVDQLEQALQQLSAMTSDRDWLRGELDKAIAESEELRVVAEAAKSTAEALSRTTFIWPRQGGKTHLSEVLQPLLTAVDRWRWQSAQPKED